MDDLNAIAKSRGKASKSRGKAPGRFEQVREVVFCFLWCIRGVLVFCGVCIVIWVFFVWFRSAYYKQNDNFMVMPDDIVVRGNSTVTQGYILQCFNINGPRNAYDLVNSDIVPRLRQRMPILKDAKMSYTAGGTLEIWVEERMPLAQIAGDIRPPLVVDEEGMIFIYSRATGGYPEVGGFDLPDEVLCPGQKLPESLHCMLRLLSVASDTTKFFPSAVKRVSLLGIDPDDGLKVTLVDGRKIDIAWDGMATETAISEGMVDRLHKIARVLRSSAAEGMTHFNAMAPDRVTVSE
jgi:hypothetical protein